MGPHHHHRPPLLRPSPFLASSWSAASGWRAPGATRPSFTLFRNSAPAGVLNKRAPWPCRSLISPCSCVCSQSSVGFWSNHRRQTAQKCSFVPWQQGVTSNPEATSIYSLPSPPGVARLRTDLVRIGFSYPLRPLGRWDDADPCNFNFSCPTQCSASEGQNLFAFVIRPVSVQNKPTGTPNPYQNHQNSSH